MTPRAPRSMRIAALFVSLALAPPLLHGQVAPKRLSDWLLEQPATPDAYPLGLSWRVPKEVASQLLLYHELLESLSGLDREGAADPDALGRLRDWVHTLPVTGRVPVAVADARWLQANPVRDPSLQPGHTVVLPGRPWTVTVITGRGERCAVTHLPGFEVAAYLDACAPAASNRADWAWIAQPDGRMQRFGVAGWNREAQDEPAPGAWIWAPPRDGGWPERFSERLIRFLATQGPAPDRQAVAPGIKGKPSRGFDVTASDWGGAGLLQTPTARMAKTGGFTFNLSHAQPYTLGNVFVQPFDWLETGFRYINISNRRYGAPELSGSQSNKDRSFDAKFQLWRESAYLPAVAIGLRDLAGTGLFSGEYVVASKRSGALDWSLGLGWGYVGGRGNLANPLSRLSSRFDTRKTDVGQGGTISFSSFFTGPTALFGGVQYQSTWERLIIKLEYDGNDYQHEPQANNQKQSSPINFGAVYRAANWVDLTLGFERGNTLMLGLTLHTPLDRLETLKLNDPPRVPVAAFRRPQPPDWMVTSREIARQTDWHVGSIEQRGRELRLTLDEADAQYWRERVDRAAAVLHRDAPASVDRFALTYQRRGMDMAEHVIDRDAWVAQNTQALPPGERRDAVIARAAEKSAPDARIYQSAPEKFTSNLGIDYRQTLGGPDAFVLFQLSALEHAKLRLSDKTWLEGGLRLGLIDNYDKFKFDAPSNLPRVRTFLREYLTTSKLTMPNLQLTHFGKLGENQHYSLYGGYLEEMFAGVGGEWLYRPFGSRTAFGVDLNAVQQRSFEQNFNLRDYRVVTGHATMYWDTGWQDVQADLSVGRYLARDVGATLDVSRVFKNGVRVGAYATKTNVTAAQFGEGSFDKALYVSIPFDAMLTRSSSSVGNFVWKPLTRDGGAKLVRSTPLYDLTSARSERTLWTEPAPRPNELSIPADRRETWTPRSELPAPYTRVAPRATSEQWASDDRHEYRLVEALHRQRFRSIRVTYDDSRRLILELSNDRIRPISRAVGRAARTALRLAPLDAREFRITMFEDAAPIVTYEFVDRARLESYFNGAVGLEDVAGTIAGHYVEPGAREPDPLARLDDLATDGAPASIGSLLARPRPVARVSSDLSDAAAAAASTDWLLAGVIGAGLVLTSAALDQRGFRFVSDHAESGWLKGVTKLGNAIPWIGFGASAFAALDGSNPGRSRTGYAAMEAGATAYLAATGLKYAVGRARPQEGLGNRDFNPFTSDSRFDAFPSRHAAVAWAVATPFAEEYGANWLYGVAVLTNVARVASREHWFSDTVAGSLIGYGIGRIFWESSRARSNNEPRVMIDRSGAKLAWEWQ